MNAELMSKFLTNTDETGRFIYTYQRTGKVYAVEPIGNTKTEWGSIDPATGNLMNKKGHDKYRGSVDAKDSLITAENGFKNIVMLDVGTSPFHALDVIDAKYPDKG
jgi:hypothetical protein